MFIISDPTGKTPFRHRTEDIETAADIIFGITGEERDYEVSQYIMGDMHWDDYYKNDRYKVVCIKEEELEECCEPEHVPIAENLLTTVIEMCDRWPRLMEKIYRTIGDKLEINLVKGE